jgi:hypothetical protein
MTMNQGKVVVFSALLGLLAQHQGAAQALAPASVLGASDSAPISLNFQNTEVRALMQVFADFTGLNFVTTDSVSGQVSVRPCRWSCRPKAWGHGRRGGWSGSHRRMNGCCARKRRWKRKLHWTA